MNTDTPLTDYELLYAATARCQCGAGLAHPLDHEAAFRLRAWVCSAALKGEAAEPAGHKYPGISTTAATSEKHDAYHFSLYKIREETSINNRGRFTTRPPGTIARTVGKATCPRCQHAWQSEPYDAPSYPSHHWFPGPCAKCGYDVGASGSYSSNEGEPIKTRYSSVVLDGRPGR